MNRETVALYEWQTNRSFLLSVLAPTSIRIEAAAGEWSEDILRRLPRDLRVFAFHLNLTQTAVFPHDRSALCKALSRAGVAVVNGAATNIAKAFIQASCRRLDLPTTEARSDGDPDEQLIIKTNLNYGGLGERVMTASDLRMLGCGVGEFSIDAKSYKILKRRDVAAGDWLNPGLFIERFITNREDLFFRVYLLGRSVAISEVVDPAPLKRMPSGIERRNWFFRLGEDDCQAIGATSPRAVGVARQIGTFVRALQIDFAALDVVLDDNGSSYIIDVNTTPSWRDTVEPAVEGFLRAALEDLVVRRETAFPI